MIESLGVAIFCLVTCAVMAGLETGVYTLNRVRLAVRAGAGSPSARRLREELLHPNRLLATLLIGLNLAHAGLSASITAMLDLEHLQPLEAVAYNTIIVVPLMFLVDAIPKELFRVFTNSWTYGCSWLLRAIRLLLTWTGVVPVVRALGDLVALMLGVRVNKGEPERKRILQSLREGQQTGLIGDIQLEMADRVFGLSERPISECMVAWKRVTSVGAALGADGVSAILRANAFSRFPVVDQSPSGVRVVGIVSAIDLITNAGGAVELLAQAPLTISPTTSVLESARRMRLERRTMAVVADSPASPPLGIVTLKDVLEPIVGNTPEW